MFFMFHCINCSDEKKFFLQRNDSMLSTKDNSHDLSILKDNLYELFALFNITLSFFILHKYYFGIKLSFAYIFAIA